MDFASLGIKIDSSQAKTGASDLDKLATAGDKAERSVFNFGESSKKSKKDLEQAKIAIDKHIDSLKLTADTYGLSARAAALHKLAIDGATASQLKQADAALKHVETLEKVKSISESAGAAIRVGAFALAAGVIAAAVAFEKLIGNVAKYQDLAEQTGGDAAGIASLRTAADVGGTSLKSLTAASNRLQLGLSRVDDESKGVGNALASIGIEVESFKKLRPDEQMREIGKALNQYADDGNKVAVIQGILGRGAASMLSSLKELGNEQESNNRLTNEQIRIADDYKDAQARSRSELLQLAETMAVQVLPAVTALTDTFKSVIPELLGIGSGVSELEKNKAIQEWSKAGAESVAFLADAMLALVNIAKFVVADVKLSFENLKSFGDTSGKNKEVVDAQKVHEEALNRVATQGAKFRDALSKQFADAEAKRLKSTYEGYTTGSGKASIAYSSANGKKSGTEKISEYTRMAEAIAKVNAQTQQELDNGGKLSASEKFRLDEIQKITFALKTKKISQAESIDLLKQAGTATEKLAQIEKNAASVKAAQFNFAEQIEFQREVEAAEVALSKAREQGLIVVSEYSKSIDDANKYTLFQLSLAGQTEAAREKEIEYYKIKLDLQKQLDAIDKNEGFDSATKLEQKAKAEAAAATARAGVTSKSQLQATGFASNFAQSLKDPKQLEIERNAENTKKLNEAIFLNETEKNRLLEAEKTRHLETMQNMQNSYDLAAMSQMKSVADQVYGLLQQAGKEKTALGKAVFLASKAIAVAEIIVNTEAAAAAALRDGGTFAGIPLAAIIRATGYASAGIVAGTAIAQVSGGKASGGSVDSGGMYRVNERGPEMLSVKGQDFLMMGDQGGVVTPNSKLNGGNGGITIVNNTSAKIGKVVEQRMPSGERALIIQEAVETMAGQFSDPNSRASRGISRNYSVQRTR
jgi:hypothetical protein